MNKDSDRQADSGITREELKDMLQKYNIGKKPLSKLLGWGETTILLYLREDEEELPDNEYTRRLKNLYTHTTGFLSLLNSGQNRISSVAKRRSIDAVRQLFPTSPIFDAAEYVVGVHRKLASEFGAESMSLVRLQACRVVSHVASRSRATRRPCRPRTVTVLEACVRRCCSTPVQTPPPPCVPRRTKGRIPPHHPSQSHAHYPMFP